MFLPHTTNETENQPLPIWKLQVPQNAMHVWINRIEDGKVIERFELGKEEFGNKTITTFTTSYQKNIDITDRGLTPEEWYLICMDLSISYSKQPNNTVCQHCTLLRAATDDGRQVGISASLAPLYSTANSVRIKYQVDDIPFNMAMIVTQAYPFLDGGFERCTMTNKTTSSIQSTDLISPSAVVFVDLDGLLDIYAYR
uniref:Uncharacterized protein n=1 Tax=Romanomermis culicivorax TaxID=13658 RepID=A0A915JC95_ROMCU